MNHTERLILALAYIDRGHTKQSMQLLRPAAGAVFRAASNSPFVRGTLGRLIRPLTGAVEGMGRFFAGDAAQGVATGARALPGPAGAARGGIQGLGDRLINWAAPKNKLLNTSIQAADDTMGANGQFGRGLASKVIGATPGVVAGPHALTFAGGQWVGNQMGKAEGGMQGAAQVVDAYQNMPFMQRMLASINPAAMEGQLPPEVLKQLQQIRAARSSAVPQLAQ